MKKTRIVAFAMAVILLLPVLASCSPGKTGNNTVKEDDPWYDLTKFKIEKDIRQYEQLGNTGICTGSDRVFSVYPLSKDHWGSCRTVLDTYDLEGNLLGRKELSCPDGFRVQSIYSVSADPDGKTVKAAVYLNSSGKQFQAFIDIDTETGTVSNIKNVLNKGNTFYNDVYAIDIIGDYAVVTLNNSTGTAEVSFSLLLFKDSELVGELDTSTVNINYFFEGFSLDLSSDSLYVTGYEYGDIVILAFDINSGKFKSKKSPGESDDKTVDLSEYTATDRGDLCKLDSLGNVMKIDAETMTPVTMVDTNWYTPFFHPTRSSYLLTNSYILSCTETRTVILDQVNVSYGIDDQNTYEYVTVLEKAEKNPHAGKEIIEIAVPVYSEGISDYLAKAVYEFNKTDDRYLIRVWDKYKSGFTLGRMVPNADEKETEMYEMIQDLKGDEAPDLVISIQQNYAMRDDVFMDLTDFLDPEVMDKQYANIIEAGRYNGKLYFLPVTLELEGLVINTELLKDGAEGITFEDFDRMVKEELNGFSPYDYPDSLYCDKLSFILSCIDTKSAIEGEDVDFGTEQFRSAVEYANENFVYDDDDSVPVEYLYDSDSRHKGECCYLKITDYLEFVHILNDQDGHYAIIGTPSVDASGPRFTALETVSVSAVTDVKEGCRKFINYLFSGSAYDHDVCEFRNLVTNRDIMNRNIETLTLRNNEAFELYLGSKESGVIRVPPSVERAYGDKYATDDMRESFLSSMSTVSTYYYGDPKITGFVMEEVAPYYAGDRSLDDVVRYLNDRTTKYIREM